MKTAETIISEIVEKGVSASTTPSTPPSSGPGTAGQRERLEVDEVVDDVIRWMSGRFRSQISKIPITEKKVMVEGLANVLANMTPAAVRRAMTGWAMPYPPDPAAFAIAGERQDAGEQFVAAAQAAGRRPAGWHRLDRRTYRSAIEMAGAGFQMSEVTWGDGHGAAAAAWLRIYRESTRLDDLGQLPPPPPPPAGALEHRRDQAAADRGCAALHDVLAGRIPPPPPPPNAEYLDKIKKLGIRPR